MCGQTWKYGQCLHRDWIKCRDCLPVLVEGPGSIDGGLVVTGGDSNVVITTVGLEGSLVLSSAAGVVGAVGFNYVVLHKRVAGPSVHSEVSVTLRVEGSTVVDGTKQSC